MKLGGAVLAGGRSRRMGSDKAFIEIDGRSMLERAVDALEQADAEPVLVVGGDRARVADLGLVWAADRWPGEGPLGGIITALETIETELVAILPCDLIGASPVGVITVANAIGKADVAVPTADGHSEWLHAVWRIRPSPAA